MPNPQATRIRQGRLIFASRIQSITIPIRSGPARCIEPFQHRQAEIRDSKQFLLTLPEVRSTEQVSELPHRRKSVDIDGLNDSERRGFLHEAEALKQIPAARAELLAVFRHVPIEVISRLRFLSDRKEILFSVSGEPRRTHTRVHDMAVIRDTDTHEVHMVPHRTLSRPVRLTT